MTNIKQHNDPILRQKARSVSSSEFNSPDLQEIIGQMRQAVSEQPDGVAIAGPQIGVPLRIFLISGRAWQYVKQSQNPYDDMVFINPEIVRLSKVKQPIEEGCLSVRWWYGYVERADKARVEAQDITGRKFTYNGSGLIAQIFQHEIDHLNGILFTDRAKKIWEVPPDRSGNHTDHASN